MSPEPTVPLVFAWPYALVFWATFVWAFSPEFRVVSRRADRPTVAQDAGSKRVIMITQPLGMVAAFLTATNVRWAALPRPAWLFWAGMASIVCGSLLRRHCFRMLGASFTGAVIVRPDQAVIERGAYRYVRHPSYTAGALMFLGIGLALANGLGLLAQMGLVTAGYWYRVVVEERALAATIGEPYRSYRRRTKRFVPFMF
jgi:protein-S-isoprenylcysteine O-methyltransferase Ste14